MLSDTLNTNEIKNAAGTEVEFQNLSRGPGRSGLWAQINETYSRQHRFSIRHEEIGTGIKLRRRTAIRFDKYVVSDVDSSLVVPILCYQVMDIPIGALTATTEPANVLAELGSLVYSLGASTTILYDGSGNGGKVFLLGGL